MNSSQPKKQMYAYYFGRNGGAIIEPVEDQPLVSLGTAGPKPTRYGSMVCKPNVGVVVAIDYYRHDGGIVL